MNRNLRERLRIETRPDHHKVDRAFASHDIATRTGFTIFIQSHEAGFSAMMGAASPGTCQELRAFTEALRADLSVLDAPRIPVAQPTPQPHPLACDYMVAGSRLGTAVMRKRWSETSDPIVRGANHYFGLPWDSAIWRELCQVLSKMDGSGIPAEQIVGSTKSLFAMFADLAHQIGTQPEGQHATATIR